jgi:hypothetical protein
MVVYDPLTGSLPERWYPAVKAAAVRRFAPRIMRHTAASWLVQDGVPLYDVQALLGHEDYATTQRYALPGTRRARQGDRVVGQARSRIGAAMMAHVFRLVAHVWRTDARKAGSPERETGSDLGRGGRI